MESLRNTKKLPPVFKKKWIKALKSGKYIQGNSYLYDRDDNKYCCLGVACRVAGLSKEMIDDRGRIRDLEGISKIPYVLREDKTFKDSSNNRTATSRLINMNDQENKSFVRIANWIEKNL